MQRLRLNYSDCANLLLTARSLILTQSNLSDVELLRVMILSLQQIESHCRCHPRLAIPVPWPLGDSDSVALAMPAVFPGESISHPTTAFIVQIVSTDDTLYRVVGLVPCSELIMWARIFGRIDQHWLSSATASSLDQQSLLQDSPSPLLPEDLNSVFDSLKISSNSDRASLGGSNGNTSPLLAHSTPHFSGVPTTPIMSSAPTLSGSGSALSATIPGASLVAPPSMAFALQRCVGIVQKWFSNRSYGFLLVEHANGGFERVFCSAKAVRSSGPGFIALAEGQIVEFAINPQPNRRDPSLPEAIDVSFVGGVAIPPINQPAVIPGAIASTPAAAAVVTAPTLLNPPTLQTASLTSSIAAAAQQSRLKAATSSYNPISAPSAISASIHSIPSSSIVYKPKPFDRSYPEPEDYSRFQSVFH